jgi:hypothetical protein
MEILYILGIYIILYSIGAIFSWVSTINDKHKSQVRDQVLYDIQRKNDIQIKIREYQQKLTNFRDKYFLKESSIEKDGGLVGSFKYFLSDCPICQSGRLVARKGKYGEFIGCSNYPNCSHTEKINNMKNEYKIAVKDRIIDDIRKAYN